MIVVKDFNIDVDVAKFSHWVLGENNQTKAFGGGVGKVFLYKFFLFNYLNLHTLIILYFLWFYLFNDVFGCSHQATCPGTYFRTK